MTLRCMRCLEGAGWTSLAWATAGGCCRRTLEDGHLVRDYEKRIDVSKAVIQVAFGSLLLLRRISGLNPVLKRTLGTLGEAE
jgi:hypothetical protein